MKLRQSEGTVLVACPDARPPAFQAVIGLHRARRLRGFLTACYYDPGSRLASLARRLVPRTILSARASLAPPPRPGNPRGGRAEQSRRSTCCSGSKPGLAPAAPGVTRALARWRTKHFDAQLARTIERTRPELLLAFSDVGSMATLPLCRRLGIKTIVSMVHGDVREEQGVLERETAVVA